MRKLALLASLIGLVCCSTLELWGYTLTFDDIPTGKDLGHYYEQYGFRAALGWEVVDSAGSGWGTSSSGTQAVIWTGDPAFATGFGFGVDGVSEYTVRSVGAFFTTQPGVVLVLRGYTRSGAILTGTVGDAASSWTNRYVEISSPAGDIAYVHIDGLSSPDARYHFAMDDLTVLPVPEPAGLVALGMGALPLAGMLVRRRRCG